MRRKESQGVPKSSCRRRIIRVELSRRELTLYGISIWLSWLWAVQDSPQCKQTAALISVTA
jgi:hypothetical protein